VLATLLGKAGLLESRQTTLAFIIISTSGLRRDNPARRVGAIVITRPQMHGQGRGILAWSPRLRSGQAIHGEAYHRTPLSFVKSPLMRDATKSDVARIALDGRAE
jgi:hypothetical protein